MRTLKKFIEDNIANANVDAVYRIERDWVRFPGFKNIYVRAAKRTNDLSQRVSLCLDIANCEASKPHTGAMKTLHKWLKANYPWLPVYHESVTYEWLANFYLRIGFSPYHKDSEARNYWIDRADQIQL